MKLSQYPIRTTNATRLFGMLFSMAAIASLAIPSVALAATDDGGLGATACGFLTNITGVLNAISIVVVTIAVIFSGYQIAFAHKRIAEVAPVMIGGILIGAASQIANLFLKNSSAVGGGTSCSLPGATGSVVTHALHHYAAVMQFLQHYA